MHIEETALLAAEPAAVHELMTTSRFQDAKARSLGAVGFTSAVTPHGEEVTVTTRRVMSPANVPELIKAMVDPTITVTEEEVWRPRGDGGFEGTFTVRVSGAPIQVDGHVVLAPTSSAASTLMFSGELRTSVPLFKSAIERAAAGQVVGTILEEFRLLNEWLPQAASERKVQ